MSKHDVIVVYCAVILKDFFGFIHFGEIHPLRFSGFPTRHCSFVIQSKEHLVSTALQKNEQESPDKRLTFSYKSTDLPSPTPGKCTISE